jgi:hypothetical protein
MQAILPVLYPNEPVSNISSPKKLISTPTANKCFLSFPHGQFKCSAPYSAATKTNAASVAINNKTSKSISAAAEKEADGVVSQENTIAHASIITAYTMLICAAMNIIAFLLLILLILRKRKE